MPRYLTKSRFTLALDCPSKLFYTGKTQYPNKNSDNEFLEALAKGGYQVGALAKCYYPNGHDIESLDYNQAVAETNELLEQENVVIFEAAIQVERFFIRVDILEKRDNTINLIEVKSKSFEGNSSLDLLNKSGYIDSNWRPYVYDVAFQKHVLSRARPEWQINAFLMLADKNATANIDGLNQKFLFRENHDGRTSIEYVGDVSLEGLGNRILTDINVDGLCERIYQGTDSTDPLPMPFGDYCSYLADHYWDDDKIVMPIHKDCGNCEYRATQEDEQAGRTSGFKECWSSQLDWTDQDFEKPSIFDIWDFRRKPNMIEQGIFHYNELKPFHIGPDAEDISPPLIRQGRQWLQVTRTRDNDPLPFVDIDGLKEEMSHWVFPLHMIDFETSTLAIPFYKGMKPYETVAFQFSHHTIQEDGTITHFGEFINVERGFFPNFEFVRKLRNELTQDHGSVFRYASHENTVLNHILAQLQDSEERDKQELIDFIKIITHLKDDKGKIVRKGERDMIDLLDVVKKHYWHPSMGGSNSLKVVLPAILNSSTHIQKKYSKPIYGMNSNIRSHNYNDGWIWIQRDDNGEVTNPYKLLPPIFDDLDQETVEEFHTEDQIADGGAAMTAYGMIQFAEMSKGERDSIIKGLLNYCELDTLAMVLFIDYISHEIKTT